MNKVTAKDMYAFLTCREKCPTAVDERIEYCPFMETLISLP